ncbi:MAG: hypothetical protein GXY07_18935 [Candidatus Hydrogenedentes bacterium]|nr:hypothetical protein [Candidatus Hydrogenedentota bacterium]
MIESVTDITEDKLSGGQVIYAPPGPDEHIKVIAREIKDGEIAVWVDTRTAHKYRTLHGRAQKAGFKGKAKTAFLEYHYKVLAAKLKEPF